MASKAKILHGAAAWRIFGKHRNNQGRRRLNLLPLHATYSVDHLTVRLGDYERRIPRREDPGLAEENDEDT